MTTNRATSNRATTSASGSGTICLPAVAHRPTDDVARWTVTGSGGEVSMPAHWQPADWRAVLAGLPAGVRVLPVDKAWSRSGDGREWFALEARR